MQPPTLPMIMEGRSAAKIIHKVVHTEGILYYLRKSIHDNVPKHVSFDYFGLDMTRLHYLVLAHLIFIQYRMRPRRLVFPLVISPPVG